MNILHLCSYYIGNKLYKHLFQELSKYDTINQKVYIPVRDGNLVNKNFFKDQRVMFYYDNILKKKHRILYKTKIKKQLSQVQDQIGDLNSINIVHAHTLFSDGGTAYLLKKRYGIKYILNVRATDINVFYKYGIHLRGFIKKVILEAESIVFISNAYKEKTFNLFPEDLVRKIKHKVHTIPNGISNIWFNMEKEYKGSNNEKIQLLFTGSLDKNKNLKTVLKVLEDLNKQEDLYYLNIAGDGPLKERLERYSQRKKIDKYLTFHGQIESSKLIKLMDRTDIFVLPSKRETFGVSYIEAISRGVPVVYSKGQGIYGLFTEGDVGYAVEPKSVRDIVSKIKLIQENKNQMVEKCKLYSGQFNWSEISKLYKDIYQQKGTL